MGTDLTITTYGQEQAGDIRELLLDVHADSYTHATDAFHRRERFASFIDHWSANPSWVCVVGHDEGEPIGFAYGAIFEPGRWWKGSDLPDGYDTAPSFAVSEVMVRPKWRGQNFSQRLHDAMLTGQQAARATLLVDVTHPKVQALYESWGYSKIGEQKPFEDSPVYAVMVKPLATE